VQAGRVELAFLLIVALATAMTIPVVGTLLVFSLMIGAPAAARAICRRPGTTLALSVAIALLAVAVAIVGSYQTDYPVGFFVGTVSAACYVLGRVWAAMRRRRSDLESGTAWSS
jgi:zinc/manganese transport system permease protein